jgi:hypothetical protein
MPASMLDRPMKRICPSLIFMARSNTLRHRGGLMKGSKPSTTSISAKAPSNRSRVLVSDPKIVYFFAGLGAGAAPSGPPRMAWKKSLLGSTTITSDLLRKLVR